MKETKLISKEFSSEGGTEILDISEVKDHLYIDSANTDFDTVLTSLTGQVRQYLEEITALSLIDRTVTIIVDYQASFNLPFAPLVSFDSASRKVGINEYEVLVDNDDYEVEFGRFRYYSGSGQLKIIYDAGYDANTLPYGLKMAWLNEIARRFAHRGDQVIIGSTNDLIEPYKMLEWLM